MPDTSNPTSAGPAGDGSKSLAPESKAGAAVQFVLTVGATGLLAWLANLDTSHWSGWWAATAVAGVGAVGGLLTSYLKRNR
jgi:CDP-diglyceride synthetase